MSSVLRHPVGAATLVRVPYVDVLVDADVVGLTPEQVQAEGWATPTWAEGGRVRVGAAVWIVESDGRRIVVDPTQAADDILRTPPDAVTHQEAVAAALDAAGYPRESIGTVLATHIDGIGMIAWWTEAGWAPFFPNARVVLTQREVDAIAGPGDYEPSGGEALLALVDQGVVDPVGDSFAVTDEVTLRWTGAHSPGHAVVEVASGGERATLVGHLALTPLHCRIDSPVHIDAAGAQAAFRALADGRLLAAPLWPAPGAVRWAGDRVETVAPA